MSKSALFKVIKRIRQAFSPSNSEEQYIVEDYRRIKEMLERRSDLEEIGLLAASIEHDIKTPLAVIDSIIYRMKKRFQANPEVIAGLEKIEEQKQRIYTITQIIPVLRADTSFSDKYKAKVSVREVINRCIKEVKQEVNTQNISFIQNAHSTKEFIVNVYPQLLQQAIINVLKNAIEAIRECKRQRGLIDITLNIERDKNLVRVEIRDNGCGISEETIQKLTTQFTTKVDKSNRGLGLFITNRIVKIHGGNIEISSEVNEGTSVSIILPRHRSEK